MVVGVSVQKSTLREVFLLFTCFLPTSIDKQLLCFLIYPSDISLNDMSRSMYAYSIY